MLRLTLLIFCIIVIANYNTKCQVTTNQGSGLAACYPTLADAISALNAVTINSPIIITLNANETAPAGGYVITAEGSNTNNVTINGNQYVVTASASNVAGRVDDAVFKLIGADFIILQNFIIQENPLATNPTVGTNTVTEWGIALLAASLTNGAQNNTIQDNIISLRVSASDRNTFGIYSNVAHSATSVSSGGSPTVFTGTNSKNKFYGNKISKVTVGIVCIGSTVGSNPDIENEIGGSTPTLGNSITEWGNGNIQSAYTEASSLKCAILSRSQINENISSNTITSNYITNNTNGTTITAIQKTNTYINPAGTSTIANNTITIKALDHFLTGINCSGTTQSNMTLNIVNNKLIKWTLNITNTAVGITGIFNAISAHTLNITGNNIRGLTTQQTDGTFTGIENQGAISSAININNNLFGNDENPLVTFNGITGIAYIINNSNGGASSTLTISGNVIDRIAYAVSSAHTLNFINISSGSSQIQNRYINQNIFKNLNLNKTSSINFFNLGCNIPANGVLTVNNNSITGGFTKSGASGDIKILDTGSGFSAGTNTAVSVNNNNFSGITSAGTSLFQAISYNLGQSFTATGNTFSNCTLGGSNLQGNYIFSVTAALNVNISDNLISDITTPFAFFGINNSQTGPAAQLNNNQIFNITAGTALNGLGYYGSHNTVTISNNKIYNLTATNGNISGLDCTVNSGTTVASIFKNKISGLTANGSTNLVRGLIIGSSSFNNLQCTASNNIIGGLQSVNSNVDNSVRAIDMTSTASTIDVNLYYNTVYLDAVSTGATFGSSVITSNTFSKLDLRNNILVNNSTPNGTGLNVVLKNTSVTVADYKSTSGNNLFYAGVPGTQKLIYNSGANSDQTLTAFQSRVYPRDSKSLTELPTFLSLTGTSANYLHLHPSFPTMAESGGSQITGLSTDFDDIVRAGNVGYTGTGSSPDMGADEGEFILNDAASPIISYANLPATASLANRTFDNVSITDISGINTMAGLKPRVYFKKKTQSNAFNDNTNATDGWKYAEATGNSSPFDFIIDYSLLNGGSVAVGDTIQYFVIAQDMAAVPNAGLVSGILSVVPASVNLDASHFPLLNVINAYAIRTGIEGTKTICNSGCDYTSLTNDGGIFQAINNSLVTNDITIQITDDLTSETGTHPLNEYSSGKTILIRPFGGQHRTISGTPANGKALIDLVGADNVTIDGINDASDALTISNLSTSSTSLTSTIKFSLGANANTLIRCNILGSSTVSLGSNGGVIVFNNATQSSNNNLIKNCNIGPAGSNLPVALISANSSLASTGNSVIDCNLYDYFSATKSSAGIYIENNTNASWTIQGNKLYQTSPRTFTTTGTLYHYGISISVGINNIVENNILGFSNDSGTGTYSVTGVSGSSFIGMNISSGISSIQGNKIQNLSFSGTSLGEMTLLSASGLFNIGTITPNIFGDTLSNGSIIYTRNASTSGTFTVISLNNGSADAKFNNNVIAGVQASNIGTGGCVLQVVSCNNFGTSEISNNIIGSSMQNSIQCSSPASTTLTGILYTTLTNVVITNNLIRNLVSTSNVTSNVTGISVNNGILINISKNKIMGLYGAGSSGSGIIYGINISANPSEITSIDANFIHTLISEAPGKTIAGINISNGLNRVSNNMIRMGLMADATSLSIPCPIFGIQESAGTNRIYHNTIIVAGTANVSAGSEFTAAFRRVSGTSEEIRNNIFSNQRSNLTTGGKHYNIYLDAASISPVINNNLYYNSGGDGNLFGRRSSTDFTNLSTWKSTLGKDAASYSEYPSLVLPLGNSSDVDLHVLLNGNSIADNNGSAIVTVTTDFDGQPRSNTTPDIGADEGDFVSPRITYTPLGSSKITLTRLLKSVTITTPNGIDNTSGFKPRIYYKKSTDANDITGWKYSETASSVSPYSFTLDYSLLNAASISVGDTIQYFVIAQDLSIPSRAAIEDGFTNSPSTTVNLNAAHFPITGNINRFVILDTIQGNFTVCNSGCDFTSLTNNSGVFQTVNDRLVNGNISISVTSDLTAETGTHSLNQFTPSFSLSIKPSGGMSRTISGTVDGKGLITLLGADNVLFDGLGDEGNSMIISNLSASNTGLMGNVTSTIELRNDASNITIRNCTVLGSSTAASGGVILAANISGSSVQGNNNNTIKKCNIGPAGSNLPVIGINISGLTNAFIIDSNIIYDYFYALNQSSGILVGSNTMTVEVTNNIFYQSALRNQTSGVTHYAIFISNSLNTLGYYTISGNIIGGSASDNSGTYDITATNSSAKFYPVYVNIGVGDTTRITNNIIKNITVSGNRSGSTASSPFSSIFISQGLVKTTNNIIGDMSGTSSITYTSSSTSTSDVVGIYSVSTSYTTMSENRIGGITVTNSSTGITNFYAMRAENITSPSFWECTNNIIGGIHAQSIQSNGTNVSSVLMGIHASTVSNVVVNNNVVKNLYRLVRSATLGNFSGIRLTRTSVTSVFTVTDNIVFNLNNAATTGASNMTGIMLTNGTLTSTSTVERNIVHSLQTANPSEQINGIYLVNGNYQVTNNVIRLGIMPNGTDINIPCTVNGLFEGNTAVGSFYHNSVYIGGSVIGTGSSSCYSTQKSSASGILRNNIFQNNRSNSVSGGHHTIITSTSNISFNSDNNLYFSPGTDGKIALIASTPRVTLDAWKNANLKDAGSIYGLPNFLNPEGDTATFSLSINPALVSPAEGTGTAEGNVLTDISGQLRSNLSPHDMGAYAGNFMGGDFLGPQINFADLPNDIVLTSRNVANVSITDISGVNVTPGLKPRLYFKKSTDANNDTGWKYVEANNGTSPFNFTIDYSLLNTGSVSVNDVIQYFIIASDLATTPNIGKRDAIFATSPSDVALTSSQFPVAGTIKSYTIRAEVNGVKTICTSGCDYNSLTNTNGAFDFINNNFITGNTTLHITSDLSGETGAVALNEFASPFTLTIRPNGGQRTITIIGTNFIQLNGADNVTIDGSLSNDSNTLCPLSKASRDLTLKNLNGGTSIINIRNTTNNPATNNIIRNCKIEGNTTSSTIFGIASTGPSVAFSSSGADNDNNQFINNQITKVQYGIYSQGQSITNKNEGTTISLNDIDLTSSNNVAIAGIYLGFENNATISGNNINNVSNTNASVAGIALGILQTNSVLNFTGNEVTNTLVSHNKINDIIRSGDGSAFGITLSGVNSNSNSTNEIINNFIYNIKSTSATTDDYIAGMVAGGGNTGVTKLFHNTIRLKGVSALSAPSFSLVIGENNPQMVVKNNIFVNEMKSTAGKNYAVGFAYENSFSGLQSNRNNFYTTSSPIAVKGGLNNTPSGDIADFTSFQTVTGTDANSKNILPDFVSDTDLHLNASTTNLVNLDGKGENAGVLNDIDCDVRNINTPDIGGDEIAGCNYPTITSVIADTNPLTCSGNSSNISVSGMLNGATDWKWYSTACGSNLIGSGTSIMVMPTVSTTYFVRGEGGCAADTECNTITINISPPIVTNTNDSGSGSLRASIICAGDGSTIAFDQSVLGMNDTIYITSAPLDINKNIIINQNNSSIIKIKTTGNHSIFSVFPGKSLTLNHANLYTNQNSANTIGRAIYNQGNLQISNTNIFEKIQNLSGNGSTIQNEPTSNVNISSTNQIIIQN